MTTIESFPRGDIIQQLDGTYEIFALPTDEDTLLGIMKDCLEEWQHIRIGMLIPGAVWEIRPPGGCCSAPQSMHSCTWITPDVNQGRLSGSIAGSTQPSPR